MTPKEKADELIDKMYGKTPVRAVIAQIEEDKQYVKQCALVAVDEILQIFNNEWTKLDFWTEEINGTINFWQEVKQEIEKT